MRTPNGRCRRAGGDVQQGDEADEAWSISELRNLSPVLGCKKGPFVKEDILEQIVEDYLRMKGYLTLTNVKYRPEPSDPQYIKKSDCVYSDIDIIGFNPKVRQSPVKVIAVNCRSWQGGFRPEWEIENIKKNKIISGRESRLRWREFAIEKWALALKRKIKEITDISTFTYAIAAIAVVGDIQTWISNDRFKKMLTPYLKVITLKDIFDEINSEMSTTPAPSDVGRLIQVLKSAKCIAT